MDFIFSKNRKRGFTLIELLVVIAIIGILASIVIASINSARTKAKEAQARSELDSIRDAVHLLAHDTGKWPNGCAIGQIVAASDNEIPVNDPCSGLTSSPPGSGCTCTWTAGDIAAWSGPYITIDEDAWSNSYYYDSDYEPYADCGSETTLPQTVVIVSYGASASGFPGDTYDCDDIFLDLI